MQVNPCGASRPRLALRSSGAVSAAGRQRAWRTAGQHRRAPIANEARLDGSQINGIDIRGDHSFVRLPEGMPPAGARSPTASARQGSAPRDHSRRTSGRRPTGPHGVLSVSARLASTQRHWRDSERRGGQQRGAALRGWTLTAKSAFITYRRSPGVVTLVHAEVPQDLSGHGPRVRAYARSARTCAHAGVEGTCHAARSSRATLRHIPSFRISSQIRDRHHSASCIAPNRLSQRQFRRRTGRGCEPQARSCRCRRNGSRTIPRSGHVASMGMRHRSTG